MSDNLGVLRIAKKAGRLVVGEGAAGIAARGKKARLIVTAADASERTLRRASALAQSGNTIHLPLSSTKEELGAAMGKEACAILTFTDVGLAACFAEKLAAGEPERYSEVQTVLTQQAARAAARKRDKRVRQTNKLKSSMRRKNNG